MASLDELLAEIDRVDAQKNPKERPAQGNLTRQAERGAGLTARIAGPALAGAAAGGGVGAMLGGVGAIPGALAGAAAAGLAGPLSDLAVSGYNYMTGSDRPMPSQAVEKAMTQMGLPEPNTPAERIVQSGGRGAIDAMTGALAARNAAGAMSAARGGGPPTTGQGVVEALAQGPGLQTAGGASGGAAASAAAEGGAGPLTSMLASMAGGVAPGLRPSQLFSNRNNAGRTANVAELDAAGVPLSPAQRIGNASASTFESVMRYLPASAPRVAGMEDATGRGYTSALMRQAGQTADNALPDTLQGVQRQFGQQYDALERATMIQPDQQLGADLTRMRQSYTQGLDDGLFRLFDRQLQRVDQFVAARAQGATMGGENYHLIQGEVRTAANQALRNSDPRVQEYGRAMEELSRSLEGVMERSAMRQQQTQIGSQPLSGTDLADAWRETNRNYAIFSRITEAMGSSTGRDKLNTGFVPPSAIAQAERASLGERQFSMSPDPFTRLVRAGVGVLPDPIPNSGTAQRSFAQNILTGGANAASKPAGGAATGGMMALDPIAGGAALGLPYLASSAWYAQPTSKGMLGLMASQSLRDTAQRK
jgi:hypothetical protein